MSVEAVASWLSRAPVEGADTATLLGHIEKVISQQTFGCDPRWAGSVFVNGVVVELPLRCVASRVYALLRGACPVLLHLRIHFNILLV